MPVNIKVPRRRHKVIRLRWWMTRPLVTDNQPCQRRVAKLHLRNRYFGCRQCLELTYFSSQNAHAVERAITSAANFREQFERVFGKVDGEEDR